MPTDNTNAPTMDSGLAAFLSQIQTQQGTGGNTLTNLLQATLLGSSGRAGLTEQPLVNTAIVPRWIRKNPQVYAAFQSGSVDPYLPTNDPQTWQVYMGDGGFRTPGAPNVLNDLGIKGNKSSNEVPFGAARGDETRTVSAVANEPLTWSEDKIKSAIKRFNDAGMTNVTDLKTLQSAWADLTQMAGARYSLSSGKIKVTPWDMLDLYKNTNTGSSGSGGFTGTHTSTQKTVSDISQGDAWAALKQTTAQMLGHDPSDQEVRDFAYRMNSLAAQNPTISTTTGNYKDGMLTNSSTKTSGGFTTNDVQQHAYQDAQNDPDYAEYQAGTTYYNAALSALGEIGNVTGG